MDPIIDQTNALKGAKVLVVDDELLIALDVEDSVMRAGGETVGPYGTLSATLSAIESESFSVAVLDVRLGRETSEAAARRLKEKGIPFLFYTGQSLPERMQDLASNTVVLMKPSPSRALVAALNSLVTTEN